MHFHGDVSRDLSRCRLAERRKKYALPLLSRHFLLDKNFGLLPRTGNRGEGKKMGETGKKNDKSRGKEEIVGER